MSMLIPSFRKQPDPLPAEVIDNAPFVEKPAIKDPIVDEYGVGSALWDGVKSGAGKFGASLSGIASWGYELPQKSAQTTMTRALGGGNNEDAGWDDDLGAIAQKLVGDEKPEDFVKKNYPVEEATTLNEWTKGLLDYAQENRPPEDASTAQRVVYGLASEAPNLVVSGLASAFATPAVGAMVYGALHGTQTAQELKHQGASEETAEKAGVVAGAIGGASFLAPASVGGTLTKHLVSGAGINIGLTIAENKAIQTTLRKDAEEISQRLAEAYKTNGSDIIVAGVMGGAFGGIGHLTMRNAKDKVLAKHDQTQVEALKERLRQRAIEKKKEDEEKARQASISQEAESVKAQQAEIERIQEASADRRDRQGRVLQNRDRSSVASVGQMNSIASNPDYYRVGPSNTLSNGAPVIAYASDVPAHQLGREVVVVDAKGNRQSMRYAVVEASSVRTSNDIRGRANPDYGNPDAPTAIAGNGRITGLQEAYVRGTAEQYRVEMVNDAGSTGIDPSVVQGMKEPILVRIMDDENITADIGDVSNISENAVLSATDLARTDAQRIDLSQLEFDDNGRFTNDSVALFVRLLPENERGQLMDKNGVVNKDARDRLDRAVFMAAYGDDALSELLVNPNSRIGNLLTVYRRLAPKMLLLEEAGELNFKDAMVEVAKEIRAANVSGNFKGLKELAQQTSMTRSPEADLFLQFWAKEEMGRKVNEPYQVFSELADYAYNSSKNSGGGLFGDEVPPVTRADLMKKFSEIAETKFDQAEFLPKEERAIFEGLKGHFGEGEALDQARVYGSATRNFATRYGVSSEDVMPTIKHVDEGEVSSEAHTQPITQGKHWDMGVHVLGKENEKIGVVHLPKVVVPGRKENLNLLRDKLKEGVLNTETGWLLTGTKGDAQKTLGFDSNYLGREGVLSSVIANLDEVLGKAKLLESHADLNSREAVKGLHKFGLPFTHDGSNYMVAIYVKDFNKTAGDRLATHLIHTIKIEKYNEQSGRINSVPSASTALGRYSARIQRSTDAGISTPEGLAHTDTWSDEVTLAEAFFKFKRADGKGLFEKIDIEQRQKGGAYYDAAERVHAQPVTQGKQWDMGSHVIGKEDETVRVVDLPSVEPRDRKVDIGTLTEKLKKGVVNEDTGWVLSGSRSDAKKTLGVKKYSPNLKGLYSAVVEKLEEMLETARLVESHADVMHQNPSVAGIHKFVSAFNFDGKAYRADIFVRDYTPASGGNLATHNIEGIAVTPMRIGEGAHGTAHQTSSATVNNVRHPTQSTDASISTVWGSPEVKLSNALREYKRIDGKSPFDSIDIEQRQKGGAYHDPSVEHKQQVQGQIRGAYDEATNGITLTRNADLTTFSHEMGHWFLTNLFKVAEGNGSFYARQDAREILKWFGLKDLDEWKALSTAEQNRYHERFAGAFEVFLAHHEVPNTNLTGVFKRIAQWLQDVYGDVKAAVSKRHKEQFDEELPLFSKEVEGVLDTFLGDEEHLKNFTPTQREVDAARAVETENILGDNLTSPENDHLRSQIKKAQMEASVRLDNGEVLHGPIGPVDEAHLADETNRLNKRYHEAIEPMKAEQEAGKGFAKEHLETESTAKPMPLVHEAIDPQVEEALGKALTPDEARALKALQNNPELLDMTMKFETEDGLIQEKHLKDILRDELLEAEDNQTFAQALKDAAVECVLRNGGM